MLEEKKSLSKATVEQRNPQNHTDSHLLQKQVEIQLRVNQHYELQIKMLMEQNEWLLKQNQKILTQHEK